MTLGGDDMSLRPRTGETASEVIERVVTAAAKKKTQTEQLLAELNSGLLSEDEFNERADAIGLTEAECERLAWGDLPADGAEAS